MPYTGWQVEPSRILDGFLCNRYFPLKFSLTEMTGQQVEENNRMLQGHAWEQERSRVTKERLRMAVKVRQDEIIWNEKKIV